MASKVQALQKWCQMTLAGYPNIIIQNMTTSWKNGLAFCALIHVYRPDLIDFDSLSGENILQNNELAFDVAERELNITALLDAPDMLKMKVPDRLSIVTYVAQYYNYFHDKPKLGGPGVKWPASAQHQSLKRHQDAEPSPRPDSKRPAPDKGVTKLNNSAGKSKPSGDLCEVCWEKVYLLERHTENGRIYHRTCHRRSNLSPTSKVFSDSNFSKMSVSRFNAGALSTPVGSSNNNKENGNTISPAIRTKHNIASISNDNAKTEPSKTPLPKSRVDLFQANSKSEALVNNTNPNNASNKKEEMHPLPKSRSAMFQFFSDKTPEKSEPDPGPTTSTPLNARSGNNISPVSSKVIVASAAKSPTSLSRILNIKIAKDSDIATNNPPNSEAKTRTSVARKLPSVILSPTNARSTASIQMKTSEITPTASTSELDVKLAGNALHSDSKVSFGSKSTETTSQDSGAKTSRDRFMQQTQESKVLNAQTNSPEKTVIETSRVTLNVKRAETKPSVEDSPAPKARLYVKKAEKKSTEAAIGTKISDISNAGENLTTGTSESSHSGNKYAPSHIGTKNKNEQENSSTTGLHGYNFLSDEKSITDNSENNLQDRSLTEKILHASNVISASKLSSSDHNKDSFKSDVEKDKSKDTGASRVLSQNNKEASSSRMPPIRPVPRPRSEVVLSGIQKAPANETNKQVPKAGHKKYSESSSPLSSRSPSPGSSSPLPTSTARNTSVTSPILSVFTPKSNSPMSPSTPSYTSHTSSSVVFSPKSILSPTRNPPPFLAKSVASPSLPAATKTSSKFEYHPPSTRSGQVPLPQSGEIILSPTQVQEILGQLDGKNTDNSAILVSPSAEQSAGLKSPVLGGLLKSLAGVRHRSDSGQESSSPHMPRAVSEYTMSSSKEIVDEKTAFFPGKKQLWSDIKAKSSDNLVSKTVDVSSDVVTKRAFSTNVTNNAESDTVPKWKRDIDRKKEERKSAEVISVTNKEDKPSKPEWQIEAEKRKVARGNGYIDPEKYPKQQISSNEDESDRNISSVNMTKSTSDQEVKPSPERHVSTPVEKNKESTKAGISIGLKLSKLREKSNSGKVKQPPARPATLVIYTDELSPQELSKTTVDDTKNTSKQEKKESVIANVESGKQIQNKDRNKVSNTNQEKTKQAGHLSPTNLLMPTVDSVDKASKKRNKKNMNTKINVELETKNKINAKKTELNANSDKEDPPRRRKIMPEVPIDPTTPISTVTNRKKITVDRNFDPELSTDFENSFEFETKKPSQHPTPANRTTPSTGEDHRSPPRRVPPPRPTSPAKVPRKSKSPCSEGPPSRKATPSKTRLTPMQIQQQLHVIDSELTDLELRGRKLEDTIRNAASNENEDSMMLEWFQLVQHKNDLVRKETDLVYENREMELEVDQNEIDRQLRVVMEKPAHLRTKEDQREEEYLLEKLLDIINQRSLIVDSMDEDRLRYEEEDKDIDCMLVDKGYIKEQLI